ncbi:hypothetical protein V5O48_000586 [Marasmius crinis-equi]|uniref:Uncharacterized protein n=1 Tax=Marasmius crinis-equi TaxID=585013 RepID=A0ABR3G1J7_9AGAR
MLFVLSCDGFIVTIPANQPYVYPWNGNASDFNTTSGGIGVLLISPPDNFQCPRSDFVNGFGRGFFDLVDDGVIVRKPGGGNVLLRPKGEGNFPTNYGNLWPSKFDLEAFEDLVFLSDSSVFDLVMENSTSSSTTDVPIRKGQGSSRDNSDPNDPKVIGGIAAGIAGGVAIICIALVIFFRVRKKSTRVDREGPDTEQEPPEDEPKHIITAYSIFRSIPVSESRTRLKSFYRRRFERERTTVQRALPPGSDAQSTNGSLGSEMYPDAGSLKELGNERDEERVSRDRIRRHVDSGWRPPAEVAPGPSSISGSGSIIDVPPAYTEAV